MSEEILRQSRDVATEIMQVVSSFSQEQLNKVPFEGSWTAGQVAEHVLLSDRLILKALFGLSRPTRRAPDKGVEHLKSIFLDFTTKLTSPDEIVPAAKMYSKADLLQSLGDSRRQIHEAITGLDLTSTCWVPPLGELTRLEMIHFVIYHTRRHVHQLKNILRAVQP